MEKLTSIKGSQPPTIKQNLERSININKNINKINKYIYHTFNFTS